MAEDRVPGEGVPRCGADYLYHHWTPFRDVANVAGNAVASTAKDAWHDVTSIF